MIRSFFIITLRILWRNKVTSFINIFSLAIGITAFILIMMYVNHETSYDKFNENYDRIYRLEGDEYAMLPPVIGDYIRDKIPEIEHVTRMHPSNRHYNIFNVSQDNPDNSTVIQIPLLKVDSTVFNVFTLPFIQGDPSSALNEPFTAVLTESSAKKLFGNKNPIGETIEIDHIFRSENQFHITGVIRDVAKSHLNIDALLSYTDAMKIENTNWNATYILLARHADPDEVVAKLNEVLIDINDENLTGLKFENFYLRPMKDLYLNGTATIKQYGEHGNGDLLWSFMAIALFVLMLAIINYVNLTTARSTLRSKEVIIKKVMGSGKGLLRLQFIAESIFVTSLSFLLAFTAIQILIPKFNQLAMVHIVLAEYNTAAYWMLLTAAILLTGIISGIYPAIMLTSFRSVSNIKGESMSGIRGVVFRRLMLTVQFSITIVLIIGTMTNLRQLQFARNSDPGFDKDHVLLFKAPRNFDQEYLLKETIKERLLQYPGIKMVSFTSSSGAAVGAQSSAKFEIDGLIRYFNYKGIDPDYLALMEMELLEGRNFSWDRLGDRLLSDYSILTDKFSMLINETAAREYWTESPIGKIVKLVIPKGSVFKFEIIGITKDVRYGSMHDKIEPMYYYWRDHSQGRMSVRISPTDISTTIKNIEKEWKYVYGAEPFIYSFLDDQFEALYTSDERTAKIIGYFTILAIIIACMGLFALSSFMAVRRTKEIGIRKALGASSLSIFIMLSREYIKWILLSILIASPIAWFLMNRWLQDFAYRIELGPDVFILAAFLALAIGLITVGWQALKSANANPVEALKYE